MALVFVTVKPCKHLSAITLLAALKHLLRIDINVCDINNFDCEIEGSLGSFRLEHWINLRHLSVGLSPMSRAHSFSTATHFINDLSAHCGMTAVSCPIFILFETYVFTSHLSCTYPTPYTQSHKWIYGFAPAQSIWDQWKHWRQYKHTINKYIAIHTKQW